MAYNGQGLKARDKLLSNTLVFKRSFPWAFALHASL